MLPSEMDGGADTFPSILRGGEALERLLALPDVSEILDVGSGGGEFATLLREHGKTVETISLSPPADHVCDFMAWDSPKRDYDALWVNHVLEHQPNPGAFLRACKKRLRTGGYLVVTVPPAKAQIVGGHVTIWNAGLLLYQLILAGFDCRAARVGTYGYNISVIVPNIDVVLPPLSYDSGDVDRLAKFFPIPISEGFNGELPNIGWHGDEIIRPPKHIAIVGLGYTGADYFTFVTKAGDRRLFADQVWGINSAGNALHCDLVFHMDDVRIQEIRAKEQPDSNIAGLYNWLKDYKGRVMTGRGHPDFPHLEEFPLEAVINKLGRAYFNSTAAYAVAYAIYLGAEEISLWGFDFTYPQAHKSERGRGCVEFWLGYAIKAGIQIRLPPKTTLMDSFEDAESDEALLYGYDTVKLEIAMSSNGLARVTMTPRDELPTAEEIEAAYNHGKHPLAQRRERK